MSGIHIGQQWDADPRRLSLRPLEETPEDLAGLARIRNATLAATMLPDDFREASGDDVAEFYKRPGFALAGNAWLMFLGTDPVAAAVVYPMAAFPDLPAGNFHLYVVPDVVHHGLGSRLLAHLERAAANRGYPVLETTIAREDSGSTSFLLSRGFKAVGSGVQLSRTLDGEVPGADLPDGFQVRSLSALGEPVEIYVETANRLAAYDARNTLLASETVKAQESAGTLEPEGILFLLDPAGRITGMIRARVVAPGRATLSDVCLEPRERGKGYGTALVAAALSYAAKVGARRVELETPGAQTPAHALALRMGFEEVRHWVHFLKRLLPGLDEREQAEQFDERNVEEA